MLTDDLQHNLITSITLKLSHFPDMTKWIANNYFFVAKSIYLAFTC